MSSILKEKIHDIYPKIVCENCIIYVKKYYTNGNIVKITLTNKEDETTLFSGEYRLKKPNYKPFLTLKDIFTNIKELDYLSVKKIMCVKNIWECEIKDDEFKDFGDSWSYKKFLYNRETNCPKANKSYKGINGKKIIIIDEINNKKIETFYTF